MPEMPPALTRNPSTAPVQNLDTPNYEIIIKNVKDLMMNYGKLKAQVAVSGGFSRGGMSFFVSRRVNGRLNDLLQGLTLQSISMKDPNPKKAFDETIKSLKEFKEQCLTTTSSNFGAIIAVISAFLGSSLIVYLLQQSAGFFISLPHYSGIEWGFLLYLVAIALELPLSPFIRGYQRYRDALKNLGIGESERDLLLV